VYARTMKTIRLDEVAYRRLEAWKLGPNDSFSNVVKRLISKEGNLGSFLLFTEELHTADLLENANLEETATKRSNAKSNPWS
jgi:predicted CopG family antitoxin